MKGHDKINNDSDMSYNCHAKERKAETLSSFPLNKY